MPFISDNPNLTPPAAVSPADEGLTRKINGDPRPSTVERVASQVGVREYNVSGSKENAAISIGLDPNLANATVDFGASSDGTSPLRSLAMSFRREQASSATGIRLSEPLKFTDQFSHLGAVNPIIAARPGLMERVFNSLNVDAMDLALSLQPNQESATFSVLNGATRADLTAHHQGNVRLQVKDSEHLKALTSSLGSGVAISDVGITYDGKRVYLSPVVQTELPLGFEGTIGREFSDILSQIAGRTPLHASMLSGEGISLESLGAPMGSRFSVNSYQLPSELLTTKKISLNERADVTVLLATGSDRLMIGFTGEGSQFLGLDKFRSSFAHVQERSERFEATSGVFGALTAEKTVQSTLFSLELGGFYSANSQVSSGERERPSLLTPVGTSSSFGASLFLEIVPVRSRR